MTAPKTTTHKNPRINVTFSHEIANLLDLMAQEEHKSVSGLVRDLAMEALIKREDFQLSKLAQKLDVKGAKQISHEDAWK